MGKRKTPEEIPLMKSELVAEAFTILMEAYIRMIGRCASGQKMTITMKSYNRYIRFSGFREYFDICLYKSGDIDIKMDEYCHDKYVERIYEYTESRSEQNLCEKLGMRQEGLFKEFISFVKNPDGTPKYENTMQYAILKKEWEEF